MARSAARFGQEKAAADLPMNPARIFTAIWLFLHIFVFPNSMYLQQFVSF